MTRALVLVMVCLCAVLGSRAAAAQPNEERLKSLQRDVDELKEGQRKLTDELQEIKRLLRAREAPPRAAPDDRPQNLVLGFADAPFKGDAGARLVLVEFTDYQ